MTDDANTDSAKKQGNAATSAAGRQAPKRKTNSRKPRPGRGRRTNRRRSRGSKRAGQANGQPRSSEATARQQPTGRNRKKSSGAAQGKRPAAGAGRSGRNRKNATRHSPSKKMSQDMALQQKAMQPEPDYVAPNSVFLYTHVRRQSYRDFEQERLQRPRWFTRLESDSNAHG